MWNLDFVLTVRSDPHYRENFGNYLFFGSNGAGEYFGLSTCGRVFFIDPIAGEDSAEIYCDGVREFIEDFGIADEQFSIASPPETAFRVVCRVTFVPEKDGGRPYGFENGALTGSRYRPHIVIAQPGLPDPTMDEIVRSAEEYIQVAFHAAPENIDFGSPFQAELIVLSDYRTVHDQLLPDVVFTIREGARICGHGTVLRLGSLE